MDELDLGIIEYLQHDGRMPFTEIAQLLNVSEGTIRNRVARLIENRTLHIVGLIDPSRLGFDAPAMIGITVQGENIEDVATEIASFPEVSYLIMVSGEYDLIVEVLCRDRQHLATFLNQSLRQVAGVMRSQTFMTLRTFKMAYGARPMTELSQG